MSAKRPTPPGERKPISETWYPVFPSLLRSSRAFSGSSGVPPVAAARCTLVGPFHYCRRRRYYARFRSHEATAQTPARPFRPETAACIRGAARGSRRGGAGRCRRRHRDPQAPRRVHRGVGRIAPARNSRPLDSPAKSTDLERCPFCPGGVEVPFSYDAAVFDNRFPSFRPDPQPAPLLDGPTGPAQGRCEVVLYTDRHDAWFGELSPIELARVVAIWIDRGRELWADPAHSIRLRFREPGRRGRSHHRAPARADLRARSRPAGHGR